MVSGLSSGKTAAAVNPVIITDLFHAVTVAVNRQEVKREGEI